jgi:hypothetical protein
MSFISKPFSAKPPSQSKNPAEVYAGLRNMILTKRPPNFEGFWGVVMDIGVPNGSATMIAVADGTISLYTSGGGGIIGVGPHDGPKRIAADLLQFAPQFSVNCQETKAFPLPVAGDTRFYLMGPTAVLTAEARSDELGSGRHPLSPLFKKCHELLTEIRLVDQNLRAKLPNRPPTTQ